MAIQSKRNLGMAATYFVMACLFLVAALFLITPVWKISLSPIINMFLAIVTFLAAPTVVEGLMKEARRKTHNWPASLVFLLVVFGSIFSPSWYPTSVDAAFVVTFVVTFCISALMRWIGWDIHSQSKIPQN